MAGRDQIELVFYLLGLVFSFAMLAAGFVVGRIIESRHLRQLAEDEAELSGLVVTDLRRLPDNWHPQMAVLVAGETVLSADRFLNLAAKLQKLVGGRLEMYERLIDRARRQAQVRMLQSARDQGATAVWNVRYEGLVIDTGKNGKRRAAAVLCYGTALIFG